MSELFMMMASAEHTRENWIAGWPLAAKNTALEAFPTELLDIDDDHLVLRMEVGPHAHQPMGLLHGGVSMLLAESAASSHACWKVDLTEKAPVGIEISGSHVRSITHGYIRVTATVLRRTRSLIQHQIDVTAEDTGELLSSIRVTNLYRFWK
jgi:1,4-dihydroxy-2-naphthoyl-CoA hydrolase